eukprot:GHVS01097256.1.p1 GENE.GHVS01097256.1~~GHVS01097256.1.p1  ORF type:complete len:372 (+),score=87.65 GHVS01097256.1:37-1152(+)
MGANSKMLQVVNEWLRGSADVDVRQQLQQIMSQLTEEERAVAIQQLAVEVTSVSSIQHFEVIMLFLLSWAHQTTTSAPLLSLLQAFKSPLSHLDQQEFDLRTHLAVCLENESEFSKAASCLSIPSTSRNLSCSKRLWLHARKAELHLKAFELAAADASCSRAYLSLHEVDDPNVLKYCRAVQAQLLEYKRKYADAASIYFDLATPTTTTATTATTSDEIEGSSFSADTCWSRACVCLLLAAGTAPAKFTSMFAGVVKQDESRLQAQPLFAILHAAYNNKFITKQAVPVIVGLLEQYQQVLLDEEELTKHIIQHNLAAASRLYEDVSLETLAELTGGGVSQQLMEQIAAEMIREDNLDAKLDQSERAVVFAS